MKEIALGPVDVALVVAYLVAAMALGLGLFLHRSCHQHKSYLLQWRLHASIKHPVSSINYQIAFLAIW